jgi:hypothetical protein
MEEWIPERNDDDTIFERGLTDTIPTKKHPEIVSELLIVPQRKNIFKYSENRVLYY